MKTLVFDIGGTSIKYGCCIDGQLSAVKETPTEAQKGGRHILETVASLICTEQGYDAIGISTAGQVDACSGTIIYANRNIPAYTGTRIREELESRFHVPVAVENDVNAAAMGEAVCGAGQGCPDFLCLTYGTGVGGAIVMNGEIFHGSSFSAAEFGAIVTHSEEKLRQKDFFDGCYERYASTTALVQRAMALDPALDSGRRIFENLHRPGVHEILDSWVDEILLGLSSLIHIFNPSCVILGGGVMAQPLILKMIQARIGRFIMPSFAHVSIRPALLGNTAGLLGANYLASRLCEDKQKKREETT
ncbi:MAG: ROK family protein [Eubacteriales bacterium]|nr:ROK family protein [Eubacteriales bacterium]